MKEEEFLKEYDAAAFDRPSVTVDLVLMSVTDGALAVLLRQRDDHPFLGRWALPGSFLRFEESLDAAAVRVLATEAQMKDAYIEQLYTFGSPNRDPRTRIVTVAYFALLPAVRFTEALARGSDLTLAKLSNSADRQSIVACDGQGVPLPLAFDHANILDHAIKRLRGKLDYSPISFALLPDCFTLLQLQEIHEVILGIKLNKPAFRRRMLDKGWIVETGERTTGDASRPAGLYRFKPDF